MRVSITNLLHEAYIMWESKKMWVLVLFVPILVSCKFQYSVDKDMIYGQWVCSLADSGGVLMSADVTFGKHHDFSWQHYINDDVAPNRSIEIDENGSFSVNNKTFNVDFSQSNIKSSGKMTDKWRNVFKIVKSEFTSPRISTFNLISLDKESLLFIPEGSSRSMFQCLRSNNG